jgi:hypothetical protein
LHCSLLLLIFAYALVGGVVFNRLEAEATEQHHRRWMDGWEMNKKILKRLIKNQ